MPKACWEMLLHRFCRISARLLYRVDWEAKRWSKGAGVRLYRGRAAPPQAVLHSVVVCSVAGPGDGNFLRAPPSL